MIWFSIILVPVNLLFLSLGALLYIFAHHQGISIPTRADDLFTIIATGGYLPSVVAIFFMFGLIAAAYSSADSALTALTTSFTVDILGTKDKTEEQIKRIRMRVHLIISGTIVLLILLFRAINNESVISSLFTAAGYTYGPLLGLYTFGLFTRWQVKDKWVPMIAVLSPILCYMLNIKSASWFNGYHFGFEMLIINGFLTFIGLILIRKKNLS